MAVADGPELLDQHHPGEGHDEYVRRHVFKRRRGPQYGVGRPRHPEPRLLPADLDGAGKGRNFENGREAFAAAQCLTCHRFGNEGGPIGPDITAIASRFSRKDILESILEPSKVVSEQYQNITVVKKDGDDVTGRLVEETDSKLVLVPNQLTGEKVEVKKSDVQSRAASKLSPMPEGLANILSKEELLDLIAYIESGGRKSHAAFRGN